MVIREEPREFAFMKTLLTILFLAFLAPIVVAEPDPPEGFRAIFNGKDLAGWHGLNPHPAAKLTGEKREANLAQQRADFAKHWTVENGELVNDGHGPYANTDEEYGDMVHAPKQAFENFEGALAQNPAQDPQNVADAIAGLINTPAGERPVRTVVDKMGMGDHIDPYNKQLDAIHEGIFGAFGMADMLKLKVVS